LYQYFPNKESMVRALVVDLAERMGDELLALGAALTHSSVEDAVVTIVRGALDYSRNEAPLHRALLLELPRTGAIEAFERVNRRVVDALADWIAARRDELDVSDPSLTAHVIVTALDGLTDHALVFRPELLESARFERELRRMVAGLLGVRSEIGRRSSKRS
jgi:AcrR family transcriptional regulator